LEPIGTACAALWARQEINSISSVGRRTKRMEEIMTPSEVAALLKIHLKTVYKLAERGVIPGNRIGRSWRFSRNDVLELVSSKAMSLSDNGDGDSKTAAVAGK
jgi:excisionase family DNA binding protein